MQGDTWPSPAGPRLIRPRDARHERGAVGVRTIALLPWQPDAKGCTTCTARTSSTRASMASAGRRCKVRSCRTCWRSRCWAIHAPGRRGPLPWLSQSAQEVRRCAGASRTRASPCSSTPCPATGRQRLRHGPVELPAQHRPAGGPGHHRRGAARGLGGPPRDAAPDPPGDRSPARLDLRGPGHLLTEVARVPLRRQTARSALAGADDGFARGQAARAGPCRR